jgi:peptidyl-prolyl cis-trans isomerase B (cyclophilin B)
MKLAACLLMTLLYLSGCELKSKEPEMSVHPIVILTTSHGDIKIELYEDKAPETVKNFLTYVDEKFYDGTIFHRVIDGFMIQGGGFDVNFQQKKTHAPIKNEAINRLSNTTGTIAMARTSDVHSATAQFFINVADNTFLDFQHPSPSGFGYCVFGKVIEGMDVVNKIKKAKTQSFKGHSDVPCEAIKISAAKRA